MSTCKRLPISIHLESNNPTTVFHYQCVSKQDIKEAVQMKVFFENRQRMLESRKVRDRLDDEETFGLEREKSSYPDRLPLHLTRVMFRVRARAIKPAYQPSHYL